MAVINHCAQPQNVNSTPTTACHFTRAPASNDKANTISILLLAMLVTNAGLGATRKPVAKKYVDSTKATPIPNVYKDSIGVR